MTFPPVRDIGGEGGQRVGVNCPIDLFRLRLWVYAGVAVNMLGWEGLALHGGYMSGQPVFASEVSLPSLVVNLDATVEWPPVPVYVVNSDVDRVTGSSVVDHVSADGSGGPDGISISDQGKEGEGCCHSPLGSEDENERTRADEGGESARAFECQFGYARACVDCSYYQVGGCRGRARVWEAGVGREVVAKAIPGAFLAPHGIRGMPAASVNGFLHNVHRFMETALSRAEGYCGGGGGGGDGRQVIVERHLSPTSVL